MNKSFKAWATQATFLIMLSEPQIKTLAFVAAPDDDPVMLELFYQRYRESLRVLMERGLLTQESTYKMHLTKEGRTVLRLLRYAGLARKAKKPTASITSFVKGLSL